MTIWIDAQLSPALANWIEKNFSVKAIAVREKGLRESTDREIFITAKQASVVVMTKDSDFLRLQQELGSSPKVIWLTCGNTSNDSLKQILVRTLPKAIELLEAGESIVEIGR